MPSGLLYMQDVATRLQEDYGFFPVIWMGDEAHDDFAKETFPACDLFPWDSLLDDEDDHQMSEQTFAVLCEYWKSEDFASQREGLIEEFDRYLSPSRIRNLHRESALRKLQSQIMDSLLDRKPEFFLASETPHNHVFLSAFYLCKWLEIPTLFFQPTAVACPALIPRSDVDQIFTFPASASFRRHSTTERMIRETFSSTIEDLSSGRSTLGQRDQRVSVEEEATRHVSPARRLYRWIKSGVRAFRTNFQLGNDSYSRAQKGLNQLLEYHHETLQNAHDSLPASPSVQDFALFAMHFQPERTTVPEGGKRSFQFDIFARAREFLPNRVPLVIKEHETQISGIIRPGHHGRGSGLYGLVAGLPNTEMLSARSNTNELLSHCSLVFTLTGSIGIEAALRGIPVIYFGNPWWAGAPGTYSFWELGEGYSEEKIKPSNEESVRNYLYEVIYERSIVGLGTPGLEELWLRHVDLRPEFYVDAINHFVETTRFFVSEKVKTSRNPASD